MKGQHRPGSLVVAAPSSEARVSTRYLQRLRRLVHPIASGYLAPVTPFARLRDGVVSSWPARRGDREIDRSLPSHRSRER